MSEGELVDVPVKDGVFTSGDFRTAEVSLRGTRCARCAETFFPPRRVCPRCHGADSMGEVTLSRMGRIHAVTHVARPAAVYRGAYMLALVDLPEGVRLLTQVKGPAEGLVIGAEVELVVEPLFETPDSQRVWGYRFAARQAPAR